MTFQDGVAYSRNVVAAKVALGLGKSTRASASTLYDMWTRLGYGKPTGIDVAGEVSGIVRDPAITPWREIDLANGAFGQGVAVTPIQLASAYAARDERRDRRSIRTSSRASAMTTSPVATGQQLISGSLSKTLVKMMQHVIDIVPFYHDRTIVPGYDVGGKTGTAQIWDPKANNGHGAWKRNLFNYSFVGFIGRETGHPGPGGGHPDRGGDARRSRESATWRCRSCRSSSSAGSRPTGSPRRTCWPTGR